jgi:hypothetical protein
MLKIQLSELEKHACPFSLKCRLKMQKVGFVGVANQLLVGFSGFSLYG